MKRIGRFFKNLIKSPRTSAMGIASLIGIGFAAAANPAILAEPGTITAILSGAGLIVAADSAGDAQQ